MPRTYRALGSFRTVHAQPAQLLKFASEGQIQGWLHGPSPLAMSGGFGAGKTWLEALKALFLSDLFPGNRGVIARRVWDELKKTTMKTFFKLCPPQAYTCGGSWNVQEKVLRLNPRLCEDGQVRQSEILFLYFKDNPEVHNLIRGLEINWFVLDQAEEIEEEFFELLLSRLGRWDKAYVPAWLIEREAQGGRPWAWWSPEGRAIPPTFPMLTCNPDTELHWIFRRFHEKSEEWAQKYKAQGYRMIHMNSLDNRFLPLQNRVELLSKDDSFKRRFVYGIWGNPEGQIHRIHPSSIIEPKTDEEAESLLEWIRSRCRLYRIYDFGDSSPSCVGWGAVDTAGNCIVYREHYKAEPLIGWHRLQVKKLSPELEKYTYNLADPSIFAKVMQKANFKFSVAEEWSDTSDAYASGTAVFWARANNDEHGTRARINEYLQLDPTHKHPFDREAQAAPRLYFVKKTPAYPYGCDKIIKETEAQRRERVGMQDGKPVFSDDRDEAVPDHGYDIVRYFIGARPPVARVHRRVIPGITADFVRTRAKQVAGPNGKSVLLKGPVYFTLTPTDEADERNSTAAKLRK